MKNNKSFFHFDLGVFPTTVFVAIGYESILDVSDKIKLTEDFSDSEIEGLAFTYCMPNGNICLLFKDPFYIIEDLTLLVHEIDHAVHGIMCFYDIEHSASTAEVSAYMTHFIFLKIIQKLRIDDLCLKKK